MIVDERANLLEALANKGVCKNKAGVRLSNQKYYTVRYDRRYEDESKTLYLKKVSSKFISSLGARGSLYLSDQEVYSDWNLRYQQENGK